ncbi:MULTISPECIES: CRISPR-associated helicase Cas3' [Frankia]|uniref:CRISPR-associated helicase Cas3' n=1 Tax=Frankia TaxID=1854 RepID=UPI001E43F2C0|nr:MULTISPECIES: CRISPR-associated helicase Cas3' [Frankia]
MDDALAVVWGKSKAPESMHLLLGHLLDTAAVAELVWDNFLSPAVQRFLDDCSRGRGRSLFALLCGLHDVGKATPAFQMKDAALADRVRAAGLDWGDLTVDQGRRWHHARAGAVIVKRRLREAGWRPSACAWAWPLIAGHHGLVPGADRLKPSTPNAQGRGVWAQAQTVFVDRVAAELGIDVVSLAEVRTPRRGSQLTLSGLIIMADWIASDEKHFQGQAELSEVSLECSRERAGKAWDRLGLRGGWRVERLASGVDGEPDLIRRRFGQSARAVQGSAVRLAEEMPTPGLMIIEAPMGEGKTEAAFGAAEVLARRFGADGVFVGMPTQATSDPMFGRVRTWSLSIDPEVPLGLLHGRARFNKEWAALRSQVTFTGIDDELDEYGLPDEFGVGAATTTGPRHTIDGVAAAEWFLGPKRGLLAPVTVGTIDQLLHAATRTKHVMLRHAGLAGRVVILDEVHAYDVYMAQFLFEALRWLADTGVPVILLSATLPPAQRAELVRAYLQGALQKRDIDVSALPAPRGYPRVTTAWAYEGAPDFGRATDPAWMTLPPIEVEVLAENADFSVDAVADRVIREVGGGGCALVVCNTVARAQDVYAAIRPEFGQDVVLLHARLVAGERAARTETVVDLLGPPGRGTARPGRLVVVATQVAEQSFDVDVDLLVSDLAPIDLLLQRAGRLFRHRRPDRGREPKVIVCGLRVDAEGLPRWPGGSRAVYGDHLLLRSAALVLEAAAGAGWSVPAQVPELVTAGYGDEPLGPDAWSQSATRYRQEWADREADRTVRAADFLLSGPDKLGVKTLEGLHERATAVLTTEERVAAVVRDGDESVEVVLVRGDPAGGYRSLAGRSLGRHGEAAISDDTLLEQVFADTVRLPANKALTAVAIKELAPLPGWQGDPWLRRARALVLDDDLSTTLGGHRLSYSHETGLSHERLGHPWTHGHR